METKPETDADALIRIRAYRLWEQAGRPEGRSDEFWFAATDSAAAEAAGATAAGSTEPAKAAPAAGKTG